MTILITGGAGFIGSRLAEHLLAAGERVVILDNFNSYYDPSLKRANVSRLKGATVIEGDIRDAELMIQIFRGYGIQRVAHLAALAGVRASVDMPSDYLAVNVQGTLNLLEAARHSKIEMFVLASTSSVYGKTERLPFTEDDNADRPLAAYPATKRSAELIAHTYHHMFGLNITVVRYFNVYGPAGRPDMMPMRLFNAAFSGEPITVFNGGKIDRDWTFIQDIVEGTVAALNRPMGYEVINLGNGQPISLSTFIDTIETLTGRTIQKIETPTPLTEPPITFCNNEKARRLLDFEPKIPVQEGLAQTWEWFSQVHNPS
jgi:UDP-glucuronate 4-epimerase